MSPDPAGLGAARPATPATWNMYMYADSDPMNFYDPDGLSTTAPCSSSAFYYNGQYLGSVADALALTADVTILAETEFTEAAHGASVDSPAEEDMIGEVIMNRWELVNGYWYLYTTPGLPPLSNLGAWGTPGGGVSSVTQNGQFAVWDTSKPGIPLTKSAQANLDAALNSAWNSTL